MFALKIFITFVCLIKLPIKLGRQFRTHPISNHKFHLMLPNFLAVSDLSKLTRRQLQTFLHNNNENNNTESSSYSNVTSGAALAPCEGQCLKFYWLIKERQVRFSPPLIAIKLVLCFNWFPDAVSLA